MYTFSIFPKHLKRDPFVMMQLELVLKEFMNFKNISQQFGIYTKNILENNSKNLDLN